MEEIANKVSRPKAVPAPARRTVRDSSARARAPARAPAAAGEPLWTMSIVGLCMFTFAIVSYKFPISEIGIGLAVLGLVLQKKKLRFPLIIWLYLAYVLWALVSAIASNHGGVVMDAVIERLKLAVIMLVVVNALRNERQIRFFIGFFVLVYVLFPVRGGIVNYAVGHHPFGRMIWNYIYNNANDLAALTLLTLGMAVSLVATSAIQNGRRVFAAVSIVFLVVVIFMTQSRGVFIGMTLNFALPLLRSVIKKPSQIIYLVLIAAAVAYWTPASTWQRYAGITKLSSTSTISEADPEGSAEQRWEIQKVAWKIAKDNPLFGVGLGVYPYANAKYSPELGARDTHNTYLNLAAEVGLPGLLLWCALMFSTLGYVSRSRRAAGTDGLSLQFIWMERAFRGYLIAALVGTYSRLTFPYLILSVLWCAATVSLQKSQQASQQQSATAAEAS